MSYINVELALRVPRWQRLVMGLRKQSEDNPRDLEELARILESIPSVVASFDADGRLLYLNAAGRRALHVEETELQTAILSDFLSEPAAERLLREALPEAARKGLWQGRGELRPKRGEPISVVQQLVHHPPEEGRRSAFTLVARPVKDPPEEREALFASSIGFLHDLNNVLGPILAYSVLAQEQVESGTFAARYIAQIRSAAERARTLCEGVLQRMRPPADAWQRVVLADLVAEVVAWLRAEYPQHEVEIESPLSTAGIRGDSLGLEQMVLNLAKNAVESLPPSGGKVLIAVRDVEGRRELRLTVQDNGHGMNEAVLGRIFEPFFSTKDRGTGVGLSVTREVVRRHRGTMSIESAPGAGTSFHVKLPLDDDEIEI